MAMIDLKVGVGKRSVSAYHIGTFVVWEHWAGQWYIGEYGKFDAYGMPHASLSVGKEHDAINFAHWLKVMEREISQEALTYWMSGR